MSSIIKGYEYDIFISYRQKDNKHDGWVTEFVDNLKGELESTFKEEISVYFDINPHDGLLETHDVDASLKDKLKCLIFIPIISRTYCDPKSFAWEHEFKAFVGLAAHDQFGFKIKLHGGNVANRILPIQIHDLNAEDRKLVEKELGGNLRGIEFIYKEPGVNRPLMANEDQPDNNLTKTFYRNQINKVANAINEIIEGLKNVDDFGEKIPDKIVEGKSLAPKRLKPKIIISSLIMVMLVIGFISLHKIFRPSAQFEKSVAVLPFRNDSPNDSTGYFIDGVMEEILTNLQTIKDLRVISRTSVEQYRGQVKPTTPEIAKKLGVNYIVEGSGQKFGNKFRLRVQLIRAAKENHLWAKSYEQEINEVSDIFNIQSQIAETIAEELKALITPTEKDFIRQKPTNDTLAYKFYLKGKEYLSDLKYNMAIDMFSKAIKQDPAFVMPLLERSDIYSRIYFSRGEEYGYSGIWTGFDVLAKADLEEAVRINPGLPEVKFYKAEQLYKFDRKYDKALELLSEIENQMPNNPSFFALRGAILRRMGKWEESLREWNKDVLLDPLNAMGYIETAHTYKLVRKYPEAFDFFSKSLLLDQNTENKIAIFRTIVLWKGDLEEALKFSNLNHNEKELSVVNYYYYKRQYDKLLMTANKYEDQFSYYPKTLNLALSCFLSRNISLCRQFADSAITELKLKIKEFPDDDRYFASLGYAYACKGEKKKAVENAQKAIKLKPIKLDAWQGYSKELDLIRIYIINGDYDRAMDKIEFLLTIPGDLSVPLLKIDPAYDNLRSIPRFKKILTTEYETKY
jgi:TolB-like protein/Flp pilus assembly protein TadD